MTAAHTEFTGRKKEAMLSDPEIDRSQKAVLA
jgi:hypothetical protein